MYGPGVNHLEKNTSFLHINKRKLEQVKWGRWVIRGGVGLHMCDMGYMQGGRGKKQRCFSAF